MITRSQTQGTGHCGISTARSRYCSPASCVPDYCESDDCQNVDCPVEYCVPCCPCACDESGRQWAFDVAALGLFRSDPAAVGLLQNPLNATEAVNGNQFEFAAAAGIEAGLTFYNEYPGISVELRGMFPDTWQSTVRENFTGTSVTVEGRPALVTTGPRNATSIYASEFRSLMLNVRWNPQFSPDTTLIVGVRSLTLDESLTSTLVDPNNAFPNEVIQSVTDNQLLGAQFGVSHKVFSTSDLCIKVDGRAGLLANDASQSSQLASLATPPVVFPSSGSTTEVAGLFELGIQAKWRLCSHANALMGYRLLALQGVSLASDQLPAVDFLNQRGLDTDSSLILQALTVGLEVHF
ncbi:MAG: hypothetical protein ABJZ55_21525 [Fuerstiella sp.]